MFAVSLPRTNLPRLKDPKVARGRRVLMGHQFAIPCPTIDIASSQKIAGLEMKARIHPGIQIKECVGAKESEDECYGEERDVLKSALGVDPATVVSKREIRQRDRDSKERAHHVPLFQYRPAKIPWANDLHIGD
jgi:hypothetical protein